MPRNKQRKQRRGPIYRALVPVQGDRAAFSGQPICILDVPITPVRLTTTITTGVATGTFQVMANQTSAFAARFGTVFNEYRIRHAVWKVSPIGPSTTSGIGLCFLDEQNTGVTPTLLDTQNNPTKQVSLSNAEKPITLRWTARDLGDLDFITISTVNQATAAMKFYTDNAVYGSPTAVTPIVVISGHFVIEFRGYIN